MRRCLLMAHPLTSSYWLTLWMSISGISVSDRRACQTEPCLRCATLLLDRPLVVALPELRGWLVVDLLQRLDGAENLGVAFRPEVAVEVYERQPLQQGKVGYFGVLDAEERQFLAVFEAGQAGVAQIGVIQCELR